MLSTVIATLTTPSDARGRSRLRRGVVWLYRSLQAASQAAARRRARRELLVMPDSLLKDIGIGRSEIGGVVITGRPFDA